MSSASLDTLIHCTVVSPEAALFDGKVEHFVAPGWDGELGIFKQHAPMVARLGVGVVRLHRGGDDVEKLAIRGGLLQIESDKAKLLVSHAIHGDDVDPVALKTELEDVLQELKSPSTSERFKELLTQRRWLEIQLSMTA
mgnify:CR=1 FL=1